MPSARLAEAYSSAGPAPKGPVQVRSRLVGRPNVSNILATVAAATALDRLDALVFTGGIGARSSSVRDAICGRLAPLGVSAPSDPGGDEDRLIAPGGPAVAVVTAREEVVIARDVARLVTKRPN